MWQLELLAARKQKRMYAAGFRMCCGTFHACVTKFLKKRHLTILVDILTQTGKWAPTISILCAHYAHSMSQLCALDT